MASLAGCRVWLTRPAGQGQEWHSAIEAAGGSVIQQSLLEIVDAPLPDAARAALITAQHADIVIATSVNAVAAAWRLWPSFAPGGRLLAVGNATASALAKAAGRAVDTPDGAHSEGLLALDRLVAVAGLRVAILGGVGGRSALVDTLTARGATVDKIALYRRIPAAIDPRRFALCARRSDVIVVTSGEALAHLLGLADRFGVTLSRHGLVAPSVRVVQKASHALDWATAPVALERMGAAPVVEAIARIWPRR